MTEEQMRRLRTSYRSLQNLGRLMSGVAEKSHAIDAATMRTLEDEVARVEADFPGLLPKFQSHMFFSHHAPGGASRYKIEALLAYLAAALPRLEEIVASVDATPVTESKWFAFVHDDGLRRILERDYGEIQRAFIGECWKSTIILAGSAIEAILLDQLQQDGARARSASLAPKGSDLTRWDLSNLIQVCVELGLVTSGAEKLSHSVREYRNLVHPGNEMRNKLVFGKEEARISIEVLNIIHRDLSS